MNEIDLKERTNRFAMRVMALVGKLPETTAGRRIGDQLFRCGTSVAANYRAACRGRSRAEFISKLGIVEEEADESVFWIDMIIAGRLVRPDLVEDLRREVVEITKIVAASRKTAKANRKS